MVTGCPNRNFATVLGAVDVWQMALPFPARILVCALKTAPALWGAIWALGSLFETLAPVADPTVSGGLIRWVDGILKAAIIFGLDHPIEMVWGHTFVGFFWALFTDEPKAKLRRAAKAARQEIRQRRPRP